MGNPTRNLLTQHKKKNLKKGLLRLFVFYFDGNIF